jgi:hypothetical protein
VRSSETALRPMHSRFGCVVGVAAAYGVRSRFSPPPSNSCYPTMAIAAIPFEAGPQSQDRGSGADAGPRVSNLSRLQAEARKESNPPFRDQVHDPGTP